MPVLTRCWRCCWLPPTLAHGRRLLAGNSFIGTFPAAEFNALTQLRYL
jgi:hypothetical protein